MNVADKAEKPKIDRGWSPLRIAGIQIFLTAVLASYIYGLTKFDLDVIGTVLLASASILFGVMILLALRFFKNGFLRMIDLLIGEK